MTPRIIKAKDFKPENVVFSTPRANKHNGKVVYVNYDFKDGNAPGPLRIQLGKMKAPFGVSGWDTARADKKNSDPTENSNDTLELSFKENQQVIIEKFEKLDDHVIDFGVVNSKDFFKKKHSKEEIKLFYKSNIKFNENEEGERDDKYPPRFKTKLLKDQKTYDYISQVYDDNQKRVSFNIYNHFDIIPKGSECVPIIECAGIWVIGGKIGMSWRPAQLKVYKSDLKLTKCEFLEDSDNEDSEDQLVEEVEEEVVEEEVVEEETCDLFGDEDELDNIEESITTIEIKEAEAPVSRRKRKV